MRSADITKAAMFSYRILKERIPHGHSLRKLGALVDGILVTLHAEFGRCMQILDGCRFRPSFFAGELFPDAL